MLVVMDVISVALAIVFSVMRLAGCNSVPFQAIAHVVVGAFIGAFVRELVRHRTVDRLSLGLAVGMTLVELDAFFHFAALKG